MKIRDRERTQHCERRLSVGRQDRNRHRHQQGRRAGDRPRTPSGRRHRDRLLAGTAGDHPRRRRAPGLARALVATGVRPGRPSGHRRVRRRGGRRLRPDRHPGQQRRRHRTHAARRRRPRTRRAHPGSPAGRRRLRAHGSVPPVRHSDEPHQPALVRHPGLPPDARAARHRHDHQHLQWRGASRRLAHAGVLRRGQVRAEPHDPLTGAGVGPQGPGQLPGAGPHDD